MHVSERIVRHFDRAHRQVPIAIAAIVILGLMLIGSGVVAYQGGVRQQAQERWHVHTLDVLLAADKAQIGALNVLRGERGYLLTGRDLYLDPYREGAGQLFAAIGEMRQLTGDNSEQQSRLVRLRAQAASYLGVAERAITLQSSGHSDQALAVVREGSDRAAIVAINQTLSEIEATERELLAIRQQASADAQRDQFRILYAVAISGLALLLFAAFAVAALRQAFAREAKFREELRRLAGTDELTGLANRRELTAALNRSISGARRDGKPLAFALLDIDHFKRVNDTFGHPAGDEVIRQVALTALKEVRGHDVVGRLGGEEFAIVLPGANVNQAIAVCERIRATLGGSDIALPCGHTTRVTISSGIGRMTSDDTAETLIQRADDALYSAKRDGRDQVRLAA